MSTTVAILIISEKLSYIEYSSFTIYSPFKFQIL